jgi:UDP-glucose-4-epimerase GalE
MGMIKQHILVSGGAGYIGSHTAYALREAGFVPVVMDDLSSGHEWAAAFGPLRMGNIGDAAFVRSVCDEFKPVALLHFAAFIEVAESVKYPEKFWDNNTTRATQLFKTVRDCGVGNVVFSSTAAVYGMVEVSPLTEDLPLQPINPYGETKLAAEQALRSIEGLRSVTLRYFNAAGAAPSDVGIGEAHWPESHLLPNVILAALGKKPPVTVFGTDYPTRDGTAVRDYVHVLDLAAAHIAALRYLLTGQATTVCNLGSGHGASVKEVLDTVGEVLGCVVPAEYGVRRVGDPATLVADAARAHALLGWKPQYNLRDIVASAAAWHQTTRYAEAVQSRQ